MNFNYGFTDEGGSEKCFKRNTKMTTSDSSEIKERVRNRCTS